MVSYQSWLRTTNTKRFFRLSQISNGLCKRVRQGTHANTDQRFTLVVVDMKNCTTHIKNAPTVDKTSGRGYSTGPLNKSQYHSCKSSRAARLKVPTMSYTLGLDDRDFLHKHEAEPFGSTTDIPPNPLNCCWEGETNEKSRSPGEGSCRMSD